MLGFRSHHSQERRRDLHLPPGEGPQHSLDRSFATSGHWLRAWDARMSSSSRSSAVNSPCASNGSSGSREVVSGKPRARLLGGWLVPGGGPWWSAGGAPHLLLPGAGVPAMLPVSLKQICATQELDQPPARPGSPQPPEPRPQPPGQSDARDRARGNDVLQSTSLRSAPPLRRYSRGLSRCAVETPRLVGDIPAFLGVRLFAPSLAPWATKLHRSSLSWHDRLCA